MRLGGIFATLALLLASIGSATAASAITSAQPGMRPAAGSDEAELWFAMDEAEIELRKSPQLVRDPALNDYVRGVACKVSGDYCKDLRIYIIEMPWFNASMAPNGILIVWTGALLRMQNEAQLALVLGHEFGHYRERHSLQQWRKIKNTSAFLSTFGVITAGAGVGVVGSLADIAGGLGMMKFGRDKEREADQIGFAKLVEQGYDPTAGTVLWDAMLREENARDYGKPIPVFASHPKTEERRDDLRAAAAAIANPGKELGTARYRTAMHPFLKQWLEGELTRRMYSTSIEVIGELRQNSEPGDRGLYTFFLGEAHRRRNKGDDRKQADALYAEAITQPGAPAEAWRENGMALRAAGNKSAAVDALKHYLAAAPAADDRAFVLSYVSDMEATP
ncbi:MAG TPA: M48 family metalloprotease [Arenimonas sp.]|uniref:M48 family metallopeptidase n=1 Tax=Arenimonas sp. TaxID=1872635 RepID=UPI002C5E166D|nr:M48 family metalloprotease [Arenimonas sp.]HMB56934.1 M48 family metalloprotease [Arenimonas sp.]